MTDLFFRSLEDLKNRIQIQSSLGGELFLCKRMEICYNKKRDDTKREVLNMAKDERNAYTIQNDASLGEVVVTVSLALNLKYDYSIMEVTKKVQEKVKNAVENMTGLEVADVNIKVAGVEMEKQN